MFDYTLDSSINTAFGMSSFTIFWTRAALLMVNSAFFLAPALGFSHLDEFVMV